MQRTEPIDYLNDGKSFIKLVDSMGSDHAIVEAARRSYQGTDVSITSSDLQLLRMLLRNRHTSPFEQAVVKFHIRLPKSTAVQLIRHRTASLNEFSTRYSVVGEANKDDNIVDHQDHFYVPRPENITQQSTINKQGRENQIQIEFGESQREYLIDSMNASFDSYHQLIQNGVAREIARGVLPFDYYTDMYWQINIHNLMHFLKLRMDLHAQYEIRQLANAMFTIFSEWMPIISQAFVDYSLNADIFTSLDHNVMSCFLRVGLVAEQTKYVNMRARIYKSIELYNKPELIKNRIFDLEPVVKSFILAMFEIEYCYSRVLNSSSHVLDRELSLVDTLANQMTLREADESLKKIFFPHNYRKNIFYISFVPIIKDLKNFYLGDKSIVNLEDKLEIVMTNFYRSVISDLQKTGGNHGA